MATATIGLTALLLISSGGSGSADDDVTPITLFVRLVDYARLPGPIRASAETQLARIFAAARVSIAWSVDPLDSRAVEVILLSDAMSDRKIMTESIPGGVLGQAAHTARRAYILTNRVMRAANHVGADPGDTIGDVIAHEIGHLLLGDNGHSATGIMQADYGIQNRISRRFTSAQAGIIRERLRADGRSPLAHR